MITALAASSPEGELKILKEARWVGSRIEILHFRTVDLCFCRELAGRIPLELRQRDSGGQLISKNKHLKQNRPF